MLRTPENGEAAPGPWAANRPPPYAQRHVQAPPCSACPLPVTFRCPFAGGARPCSHGVLLSAWREGPQALQQQISTAELSDQKSNRSLRAAGAALLDKARAAFEAEEWDEGHEARAPPAPPPELLSLSPPPTPLLFSLPCPLL